MTGKNEPMRLIGGGEIVSILHIINECGIRKPFLVCDASIKFLKIEEILEHVLYVKFDAFSPNPLYEDIINGMDLFLESECDGIIAVGGGSCIDVAKCIKLFSVQDRTVSYLEQVYRHSDIPLIAIPSTAGTGSEETRFAVLYAGGEKVSIEHDCLCPNVVILDHFVLRTLPDYQKKSTGLDALCQCMESIWSVKANAVSEKYAFFGLKLILGAFDEYIQGYEHAAADMMLGANFSGRAINITQTTAAHALSYKITSLYGVSHGHAVALCMGPVLDILMENQDIPLIAQALRKLKEAFRCSEELPDVFKGTVKSMNLTQPVILDGDLDVLTRSVNTQRLQNFPLLLSEDDIRKVYIKIKGDCL